MTDRERLDEQLRLAHDTLIAQAVDRDWFDLVGCHECDGRSKAGEAKALRQCQDLAHALESVLVDSRQSNALERIIRRSTAALAAYAEEMNSDQQETQR